MHAAALQRFGWIVAVAMIHSATGAHADDAGFIYTATTQGRTSTEGRAIDVPVKRLSTIASIS